MAYPISDVTRRVVYSGSAGVGPYSFTFEILAQGDIGVYKNEVLLTLTTDYTVTINADGTGSITLTSAATSSDTIAIFGNKGIQRSTDFVTGGDLFANSLNDELDAQTIFAQQNSEAILRSLRAPVTDPTTIDMTLPSKADRADTVLTFDTNGNPQATPSADFVSGISGSVLGANYITNNATGDGTTVNFTLSTAPGAKGNLQIYIDGVYQNKASFSLSGTTVTFTEAPPLNASIEFIIGYSIGSYGDAGDVSFTQAGTGAATRTVEAKLNEFVSVKDFGAVGDGVTDDTAAINAAITAATGGVLHFPKGTYRITSSLNSGNAIVSTGFQGAERENTIILCDHSSGYAVYFDKCDVNDLHFKSSGSKSDGLNKDGVRIIRPSYLERCIFEGFSGDGLSITSQYSSSIISCKFHQNTNGVVGLADPSWSGVSVTSMTFLGCEFLGNDYGHYSDGSNDIFQCVFNNSLFWYNDTGIYANGHNALIRNCWFESNTTSGATLLNTYLISDGNRYVFGPDVITQTTTTIPAGKKGYIDIDWNGHKISTKNLSLTNDDGLNDTGADAINMAVNSGVFELENSAYAANENPKLLTSPTQFKANIVKYNPNVLSGSAFRDNNTGFTFTKHGTGHYYVDFGRDISHFNWDVSAALNITTSSDGSGYTTASACHAHVVAVNNATTNWKDYSQADGVVVFVTDLSGTLVDGQFSLTIYEPLASIFSY